MHMLGFLLDPFFGEPVVCAADSVGFPYFCDFRAFRQSALNPLFVIVIALVISVTFVKNHQLAKCIWLKTGIKIPDMVHLFPEQVLDHVLLGSFSIRANFEMETKYAAALSRSLETAEMNDALT